MKENLVEMLVYWKNRAEQQEVLHRRLVDFLRTHHPRVWQGYEQRVLMNILFPEKEEARNDY